MRPQQWIGRMGRLGRMGAVQICVATTLATTALGIVMRHDVDAIASRCESRRFAAIGKVLPDGEAVLIAPRWVLTAAHVATGAPHQRLRVRFAGIEYQVEEVIAYPNWEAGQSDVALMHLTKAVRLVNPLALHDGELDEGSVVLIAGRGDYGDGRQGIVGNDGKMRIAQNAVWRLETNRLQLWFDEPGKGALEAEGISGPGDSGTPALVELDGKLEVVGIGSVGRSPNEKRYGEYGSIDIFIRISQYRNWIDEILAR